MNFLEESLIVETVKKLTRRYRLLQLVHYINIGAWWGIFIFSTFLFFTKFTGLLREYERYGIILLFLGVLVGIVKAKFSFASPKKVALLCDKRLKLKERLITSYEWITKEYPHTPMFWALLRDTSKRISSINPKEVFPYPYGNIQNKRLLLILALLYTIIVLPPLNLLIKPKVDVNKVNIEKASKRIEKIAFKVAKMQSKIPSQKKKIKKLSNGLHKLSLKLRSGTSQREAVKKISTLQRETKKIMKNLEKESLSFLKKKGNSKRETLSQAEKDLSKDINRLRNLLKKLKKKNLSAEEKQKIKKELQQIQKSLQKAGLPTNSLRKTIKQISSNTKEASKSLEKSIQSLAKIQESLRYANLLKETYQSLEESKKIACGKAPSVPSVKVSFKKTKKGTADFGMESTNLEKNSTKPPINQ